MPTLIIIGSTLLLAFINDASGTMYLLTITISVRGITWIVKKVTENINLDASQIIDFTGWSIAGVSMVKIISNAMGSIGVVKDFFAGITNFFAGVADIADKITFWN